jgi:hypothetical protein
MVFRTLSCLHLRRPPLTATGQFESACLAVVPNFPQSGQWCVDGWNPHLRRFDGLGSVFACPLRVNARSLGDIPKIWLDQSRFVTMSSSHFTKSEFLVSFRSRTFRMWASSLLQCSATIFRFILRGQSLNLATVLKPRPRREDCPANVS